MSTHKSIRSSLMAGVVLSAASFAPCGVGDAAPVVNSHGVLNAVPAQVLTVQDWRAERGTTWRDQLNKGNQPATVAPPRPFATPNYGTNLGYGLPGYSYSGPTYDRYVTNANRATSTGDNTSTGVDPGLSSCPQRTDTNEPSTQTYFGNDGKRHPCP